jgi:hypothetical protein
MATFVQIQTRVREWMDVDTNRVSAAKLKELINQGCREMLADFDFIAGETSDTFVTVAGTATYTMPARFSRPVHFYYLHPTTNSYTPLIQETDLDEFRANFPDTTDTGTPSHFIIYSATTTSPSNYIAQIGPTPNAVYTIRRDYIQTLADLSADADVNTLTINEPLADCLIWRVNSYVAAFCLEPEMATAYDEKYREAVSKRLIELSRVRYGAKSLVSQEPG